MEFLSLIFFGLLTFIVGFSGKNMDMEQFKQIKRDCGKQSLIKEINTGGRISYKCKGDKAWRKL